MVRNPRKTARPLYLGNTTTITKKMQAGQSRKPDSGIYKA